MDAQQLKDVMITQLKSLNVNNVSPVDDSTIHADVLTTKENFPYKLSDLYKTLILTTFVINAKPEDKKTAKKKRFPAGWIKLSVADLAGKLLPVILFLFLSFNASSQLTVNISAEKTQLKNNAVGFAFSYLKSLDSLYSGKDIMAYWKNSTLLVTPNINFQAGTQDAFSSIIANMTALFVRYRTKTVSGVITPDADKTLHIFPVSLGIETNDRFNFINGILEAGYSPYYQSPLNTLPEWVRRTKFGVYLQGGYKFKLDSSVKAVGGKIDQSKEAFNDKIFRAKGNFSIDTKTLITISTIKIGVVANSTVWYDFVNKVFYYQLQGVGRTYLSDQVYFDLKWARGSGAPNFNQGDQFGAGLTVQF